MADLALGTAEISAMRTTVESHLAGTAIIKTLSQASDSQGGYTDTYTAAATVDARLSPVTTWRGGAESPIAGRLAAVQEYTLTVPHTTALTETARVEYNGVNYEVVFVMDRTPWQLDHRALVVEVD